MMGLHFVTAVDVNGCETSLFVREDTAADAAQCLMEHFLMDASDLGCSVKVWKVDPPSNARGAVPWESLVVEEVDVRGGVGG